MDITEFCKARLDALFDRLTGSMSYMQQSYIGLNVAVRLIMVTVSVTVIVFLFKRMLKSQIKESSFLMWTLPAFLLFVYGVWPELTYKIADLTHMAYGYALVVTVPFIAMLYYLAFKKMCQISAITSKIVELGSAVSIQKHEIEALKQRIAELEDTGDSAAKDAPAADGEPAVEVVIQ